MKKNLFLLLSILFIYKAHSQSVAQRINDSIDIIYKQNKFTKKKVSNTDVRTVFAFTKSTNQIFYIVEYRGYRDNQGRADSATRLDLIFLNDVLVKATFDRLLFHTKQRKNNSGRTSLYFNNNVLIEKTTERNYPDIDPAFAIKQANDLLQRSKYVQ